MNYSVLLAAAENGDGEWHSLLWIAVLGVLSIGMGLYGIITKKLMIWGRERFFFALIGLDESAPGFPAVIGTCYCLFGILLLVICGAGAMRMSREAEQAKQEENRPYEIDLSHLPDMSRIPVQRPPGTNNPGSNPVPSTNNVARTETPKPSTPPPSQAELDQMQAERQRAAAEREAARREQERLAKEAAEKMQREKEAAAKLALELPAPSQPLPVFEYADIAVQEGQQLGKNDGEHFEDHAPEGGVMVGAIFYIGEYYGASVAGIQPIYQVGDKYVKGAICGNETDQPIQQIAKEGEVVAGFNVRTGRIMDAAQLAFGPLVGTKIDLQEGYFSEQVGSDGGFPASYNAEGRAVGGVFGTYIKGKSLTSLGMYAIKRMQAKGGSATPMTDNELRTFTSANGKFSVKAKFVKLNEDGTVSLEKEDGSRIKAPLASLSEEDQTYVHSKR